MSKEERSPDWKALAIPVLIALVGAAVLWLLVEQNRTLKQALELSLAERAVAETTQPERITYQPGDALPDLYLQELEGELVGLEAVSGGRRGVLVFLTTTCPYCQMSLPVWSRLAETVEEEGLSFTAVSLHSEELTLQYRSENRIAWPVFTLPPSERPKLKISSVPTTVVFGPGGTVVKTWVGLLDEQRRGEIEQALLAQ